MQAIKDRCCLDNCDALLMIIAEHLAVSTPPTPSEGLLVYVCGLIKRLRINKGSTEVFGLKVDFSTVLLFLSTQFHVAVQTKEHIRYSRQAHLFTPAAVGSDQ